MEYTLDGIAGMIDHSLLNPALTIEQLDEGCRLAAELRVASVCILPYRVARCAELLEGSPVVASTTIGFPHGGHTTDVKLAEARRAVDDGAVELDMVVNISRCLSNDWNPVADEIAGVIEIAHRGGGKVKVIFENCFLEGAHKIRLCEICTRLHADWVKTSTGYGSGGATLEDVRLMRQHAPLPVQVKAAGGIRDFDTLLEYCEAGVSRVGASRTSEILDQCRRRIETGGG